MNKRAGQTLRIVAGLYLAYLGGSLILDLVKGKPDNMAIMMLFGVLFLAVGGFVAIGAMKSSFARLKAERDEVVEEEPEMELIEEAVAEETVAEELIEEFEEEVTTEAVTASAAENEKISSDLKELRASGTADGVEVIGVVTEKTEE